LIATETESETAPHGKLVAGGDGIIDWELEPTDPDRVTVRFKPLVCPECEAELLEDSLVAYEIVWASEELILNELGKCENYLYKDVRRSNAGIFGLMSNLTLKLKELEEMKQLINVEFQSDHSVLYISVVAKVKKFAGEDLSNFRIFYHNSKISLPKNVVYMFKHKRTEFALAIGILLSFSILMCALFSSLINLNRCCCLGYFFSRLRKLRKDQLEVDLQKKMQDAK
jgi:hypothetical protein